MRKLMLLLAVPVFVMGLAACGSDSSTSSSTTSTKSSGSGSNGGATATLTGKVTSKGSATVSGKTDAKLEIEADDFYFKPTYVQAESGQTITVELHNEGKSTHTFTVDSLGIDEQLAPDAKKDVTVTLPDKDGLVEFHCNFHASMGMRGAFVVGTGTATASGAGTGSSTPSSTTSTTTKSGGYGY